jgi:predicted regulator of amino acid metabolism with ACT domain
MWETLKNYFDNYPSQAKIVKLMLKYGLQVRERSVYCGDVEIADSAIARAAGVDRRVVASAIATIMKERNLKEVFSSLTPTPRLKEAAHAMGWGALEIIPTDARQTGILARVTAIISDAGVSIRQAIVDDPYLTDEPYMLIVTESQIPPMLIPVIKSVRGVKSITIV